jgi:hypothetical protein
MAPPGTPLFVDITSESVPLVDIFDNPIHAQGGCQSLDGMKHTYSPIIILHQTHKQVGSYIEFCSDCRPHLIEHTKLNSVGPIPRCTYHTNYISENARSLFFSSGNPIDSREGRLAKTDMRNFAKKSGHQAKQRDVFLPLEMLGINGLVAVRKFNKNDFMFLLMFMQSYTLANRCTGLINSRMFDFNRFMWASTHSIKYGIQSVTKEVFEKTEKKPTLYNIEWRDDFPKLCWMRHLFIYINCHRYKANIDPPPPDGYKVDPADGSPIIPPHDLNNEKLFPIPLTA